MSDPRFINLTCKGLEVHVNLTNVADDWTGDHDTRVDVKIGGKKANVPGIWHAYQQFGVEGISLVVSAYLDSNPPHMNMH